MGEAITHDRMRRWLLAVAALIACALAGRATVQYPIQYIVLVIAIVASLALYRVVGRPEPFILLPVFFSFALLNRLDWMFAIQWGSQRLTVNLWFCAICVIAVALTIQLPPATTDAIQRPSSRFVRGYGAALAAFFAWGTLGIIVNAFDDPVRLPRDSWGEAIALAGICVPMAYVVVLPHARLSKNNALTAIRCILLLGASTGLLLVIFAVAPQRLLSLLGWTEAIGGTSNLVRGRTPLGHPVTVTAILTILLPVAVVMGLRGPRRRCPLLELLCAAAMFLGILFSLSRASLAVALPVLLLAVAYSSIASRRHLIVTASLGIGFVLILGVLTLVLVQRYDFSRIWSRGYYEDASVERRWQSLTAALEVWRDYPVVGVGPGAIYPRMDFDAGWLSIGEDGVSEIIAYRGLLSAPHPHNLYVQILAEFGIVGAILAGAMAVTLVLVFVRMRRRLWTSATDRALVSSFILSLLATAMLGMGGALFFLELRPAIVFWVFIGLGIRYGATAIDPKA